MSKRPYLKKSLRQRICKQARNRCGYCLAPQGFFSARFSIEHIIPLSHGGSSKEENLWLSCPACNWFKGKKTHERDPQTGDDALLFNPRRQNWSENFRWSEDGARIIGRTPAGRATVIALKLNNELAISARLFWMATGKFPPSDETNSK